MLFCFMVFGPSLIMTNKHILRDLGLHYPISLTCYTNLFCFGCVWVGVHFFGLELRNRDRVTPEYYVRNIMPIALLQGATIVLGMTSYLYLTVSFVQMLKASTPVMIVLFLVGFRVEYPTREIIYSVVVICLGTFLSGYGEANFNIIGVTSMLSAQVAEALRLVFTQKILKNERLEVIEALYYVTPAAAFWVFLASLFLEFPAMGSDTLAIVLDNKTTFLISGILAFGVNTINSIVIKITGSLMMKLLATTRNAALVVFNVVFMAEVVLRVQFCGYLISLAGFLVYNYVRISQKTRKTQTGETLKVSLSTRSAIRSGADRV